jgi:hypothetical protein
MRNVSALAQMPRLSESPPNKKLHSLQAAHAAYREEAPAPKSLPNLIPRRHQCEAFREFAQSARYDNEVKKGPLYL